MKESVLQKSVQEYLTLRGYCFWRNYVGPVIRHTGVMTKNPMAGLPDIVGIIKNSSGKMFAIELKSEKGRLSVKQQWWIDQLKNNGVMVLVANELDSVIDFIKEMDHKYGRY